MKLKEFLARNLLPERAYSVQISEKYLKSSLLLLKHAKANGIPASCIVPIWEVNPQTIVYFCKMRLILFRLFSKMIIYISCCQELEGDKKYLSLVGELRRDIYRLRRTKYIRFQGVPICYFIQKFDDEIKNTLLIRKQISGVSVFQKKHCSGCLYLSFCEIDEPIADNFKKKLVPQPDRPAEVAIEATNQCNWGCSFCFHKNRRENEAQNYLRVEHFKRAIVSIKDFGVRRLRLTGGEPLLHPNIYELLRLAKAADMYIILNTNGKLLNRDNIQTITERVDGLELPVISSSHSNQRLGLLLRDIRKIKKDISLRANTVLLPENYRLLRVLYNHVKKLGFTSWSVNRLIPYDGKQYFPTAEIIHAIIRQLVRYKDMGEIKVQNGNGLPFCCDDPFLINYVSTGTLWHDSRNRLFIDSFGRIKPFYYNYSFIADTISSDSLLEAWHDERLTRYRYLDVLPEYCKQCAFQFKCGGGNRFCASRLIGKESAPDILMNHDYAKDFCFA